MNEGRIPLISRKVCWEDGFQKGKLEERKRDIRILINFLSKYENKLPFDKDEIIKEIKGVGE